MFSDTEFENMVVKEGLSLKSQHNVNMRFGVDDNKIKGVNNLPIYNSNVSFTSHAKPNVDEFMFTSRQNNSMSKLAKNILLWGVSDPGYLVEHKLPQKEWMEYMGIINYRTYMVCHLIAR